MAFIAATILSITPQLAKAQTPAQMEYERQQREYARQQEQQRQEQQRQQQLMNENARRQQEESSRLNAPMGSNQAPASPAYQGASPQTASRRQATPPVDVAAAVASARWEQAGSTLKGETDYYVARSTIHRSGNSVKLWDMYDYKQAQVIEGKRSFSMRMLWEYDCKGSRRRMLAATAYAGHVGKGTLVGSESFANPNPWEAIGAGDAYAGYILKMACGKP